MRTRTPKVVTAAVEAVGTEDFPLRYAEAKEWIEEQTGKLQDAAVHDLEKRADALTDQPRLAVAK